jgi:hypothetical protein
MSFTAATAFSLAPSLIVRRANLPTSSLARVLSRLQYLRGEKAKEELNLGWHHAVICGVGEAGAWQEQYCVGGDGGEQHCDLLDLRK